MSHREVHVISYFSLPTDLAATMRDWPEYISGEGYSVDLNSSTETVTVRFLELADEMPYVTVTGHGGSGRLFEQVLGVVVYALSKHSDNLMVDHVV